MRDESEVKLVKQDSTLMDMAALVLSVMLSYYILDPDAFERHKEALTHFGDSVRQRISVWRARREIQSLPETDDPNVTPVTGHK